MSDPAKFIIGSNHRRAPGPVGNAFLLIVGSRILANLVLANLCIQRLNLLGLATTKSHHCLRENPIQLEKSPAKVSHFKSDKTSEDHDTGLHKQSNMKDDKTIGALMANLPNKEILVILSKVAGDMSSYRSIRSESFIISYP